MTKARDNQDRQKRKGLTRMFEIWIGMCAGVVIGLGISELINVVAEQNANRVMAKKYGTR